MLKKLVHLYRRWRAMGNEVGNVAPDDLAMVQEVLSDAEFGLWRAMSGTDQAHSIQVLHIFAELEPNSSQAERVPHCCTT